MMCRVLPPTVTRRLALADVVLGRLLGIELLARLVEIGDLQIRALADAARQRRQLAEQPAQQRRSCRSRSGR